MSSPTKLDSIVAHNSILRQLFRKAGDHQKLSLLVKGLLEEPLRSHIQLAAIRDGKLILIADSSAWAAKLRYRVPDLHKQIAQSKDFADIQTIRVKVARSSQMRAPLKSRKALPISEFSAGRLERQAESIDDLALRGALLRLAKRRGQ